MHMQAIAAGKDSRNARHIVLIHDRSPGTGIHDDSSLIAQMILRNQADAEQQRIHIEILFCALNRLPVRSDFRKLDLLQPVMTIDMRDGMAQIQRNSEVFKTLLHIAGQTVGIGHQLRNSIYFRSFQRHPSCHDQTDIAGSENEHLLSDQISVHVQIALSLPGSIDAGRTFPRDLDGTARALIAADRKNHRIRRNRHISFLWIHVFDPAIRIQVHDHRIQSDLHVQVFSLIFKALCISRSGKLLMEGLKPEAIMDALIQNSSCFRILFENDDILDAELLQTNGCSQTCAAAADYCCLIVFHQRFTSSRIFESF